MPERRLEIDLDGLTYTLSVPENTTQEQLNSWIEAKKNSQEHKTQAGRKLFTSLQSERYKKEFPDADPQTIQLAVTESRQGVGGGEIARRANLRTNVNREVADRQSVDSPLSILRYGLKAVNETANRKAFSTLTGREYDETQGGSYYGKVANLAPQSAIGRGLKSVDNAAQQKGWAGAPARLVQGFLEPGSLATLAAGPVLGGASAITKGAVSGGLAIGANLLNKANLGIQGADFAGSVPFLASDPQRFFESNLLNAAQGASAIGRRAPLSTKDIAYKPKFESEQGVAGLAGLNPDAELLSAIKRAGQEEAMANARTDIPQPTTLTAPAPQFAKSPEYAPLSTMNKGGGKKGKVKSSPDDMLAELDAKLQAERASNNPPLFPKLPSLPDPNPGFFGTGKVSTKGVPPQIPEQPKFRNIGEGLPLEPGDTTPSVNQNTYVPPSPVLMGKRGVGRSGVLGIEPDQSIPTGRETQGNGTANTAKAKPVRDTGTLPNVDGGFYKWLLSEIDTGMGTPLTDRQGNQANRLFVSMKDLYNKAKSKFGKGVSKEQFGNAVYNLHKELDTTGRRNELDWTYPSGSIKERDVFSVQSDDGRLIRYAGVKRGVQPEPTHEWNLSNGEKVPVRVVEDLGDGTARVEADGKILTNPVRYDKLTPSLRLTSGLDPTGGKFDNSEPLLDLPQLFGRKKKGQETPPKFDPTEDVDRESLAASIVGGKKKPTDLLPVNPEGPKTSSRKGNKFGEAGAIDTIRAQYVGTPNSVAEPAVFGGDVISEGALERAVRTGNPSQSENIRRLMDIKQGTKTRLMTRISRAENIIEAQNQLIREASKETGVDLRQTGTELIRRIQMEKTDPARLQGASPSMVKLLTSHDPFMEEFRRYIIDNPIDGELDQSFGITKHGYFPHQSEGRYILRDKSGGFVGRFKTRKAATVYATQNGKENFAPHVDIEEQGDFFGNYVAERKRTGALMKREGTAIAYENEDYGGVLSRYANRVVNAVEISKMKREMEPLLKELEENDLGGVAERIREDNEALSGKVSRGEELFSEWLQRNEDSWKAAFFDKEDPQYALRHAVSGVNKVTNLLKLAGVPKNFLNNAIQPFMTMMPYVKKTDFAKAYILAIQSATVPMSNISKHMREMGIGRDAVKNLELDSSLAGRAEGAFKFVQKYNFQTLGSQFSARVGYAYGYLKSWEQMNDVLAGKGANHKNLSTENIEQIKTMTPEERADAAHQRGMAWKEKVEYDSSTWNIPPALRGWLAKGLLQYKSFAIKNFEEGFNYVRGRKNQTNAELTWQAAQGLGLRAAIAGTKGVIGGKAVAYAIAYAVSKMYGKEDDKTQQRIAEQMYLGLGNQIHADMSSTFGLTDNLYGSTPIEQWARYLAGPNLVAVNDAFQAGRKFASAKPSGKKGKGAVAVNYLKSLTPVSKVLDAGQQILEGVSRPSITDREGKKTRISRWENTLRALGYTPASYIKAREFKRAPSLSDFLK